MAEYKLLTKDFGTERLETLSVYESTGGYQGLRDAFKKFTPESVDGILEQIRTRSPATPAASAAAPKRRGRSGGGQ